MAAEWREVTVAELQREGTLLVEDGNHGEDRPRSDEFVPEGVAFIRAADISDGRVLFEVASRINSRARTRITKGIGAPGDILLSHKGTVGKVAAVRDDAPAFVCSPQTTFWRTLDPRILDRRYLFAFLKSAGFHAQLAAVAGETDMAPYVSLTSQRRLLVTVPPIEVQRAIGSTIGALDDKIELNRKMSATLEAIARALFKSWFVDFDPVRAKAEGRDPCLPPEVAALFPDTFEGSELGEIPKGWDVGPLGRFFELGIGGAWGHDTVSAPANVAVRCLRGIDCHDLSEGLLPHVPTRFLSEKQLDNRRIGDGTILVEGSGSFCGRSLFWLPHYHEVLGRDVIYSNFCKRLDPLCATSQAAICWMQMREAYRAGELQAYRTGTAFPNLDVHGVLAGLVVVLPPLPLANEFHRVFQLNRRIDLMIQSRTLSVLRDALLPKLISGEVRVPEAERLVEQSA